ncbi:MAG: IS5 family transposase, partial [Nitrososphaerales archaeon]
VIKPLIPDPPRRTDGRGRPWRDAREVLNGVLWVLRTGAPWYDLPERYPPYQTCHRRFQQWVHSGVFEKVLQALATDLRERGDIDLSECFIDGTFIAAKKGVNVFGKTKRGKGSKLMAIADRSGLPVAAHVASASLHEVTLVTPTLANCFIIDEQPTRLIGDKAFDSDPLDAQLALDYSIEMIAPHRSSWRKRPKTQDGRPLRRYKRRWKVERLFGWLQNFRRILVRYDHYADNFLGFVQLGCILILLQRYL